VSNNLLALIFDDVLVDYRTQMNKEVTTNMNLRRNLKGVLNPIPIFQNSVNLSSVISGMNFIQKGGLITGNITIHNEVSKSGGKVFLDFEYDFSFEIVPYFSEKFNLKFSKLTMTRSLVILDEFSLYTNAVFEKWAIDIINGKFENSLIFKDPIAVYDSTESIKILPNQGIVFSGINNDL